MTKKTLSTTLALGGVLVAQSGAAIIWNAGRVDNAQQFTGSPTNQGPGGGGEDARFIQEANGVTPLPGSPSNTGGEGAGRDIDDDYYFAGVYSTLTDGGSYVPVGTVLNNEENMERAFTHPNATGGDRNLRYHFNFPSTVSITDLITVNFGITGMEDNNGTTLIADGWDVEVKINGVSLYTAAVGNVNNSDWVSPSVTLGDINGTAGPGFDNYVEITGTSRNPADGNSVPGGSRWLSIDYVEMDVSPIPEPSPLGFLAITAAGIAILARRRK